MRHNMGKILKLLAIAGLIATLLCSAFALAEEEGAPIEVAIEAELLTPVLPVQEEVQVEAESFDAQEPMNTPQEATKGAIDEPTDTPDAGETETPKPTITEAQAKSAALKKAKLKSASVKEWVEVRLDGDEWDIEFKTSKYKFDVEVNAYTGKIDSYEKEALPKEPITEAQAKSAALKKAKLKSASVKEWTKVQRDGDEWDVEFKTSGYKYDVDVDAYSGKVTEYKREALPRDPLTEAQAKSAALKKAGVKSGSVKEWTKVQRDGDEWEIDFKTSTYKYEVEVNANSGKISQYKREALPKEPLTEAQAKSAALKKAGVKSSAVKKWTKLQRDGDEWDIEFQTATYKYEVEINVYSGKASDYHKEALPKEPLTAAQAKTAALKRAGVKSSAVKEWSRVWLDGSEWEIVFKTSTYKYEVEINAQSGKVTDYDREALPRERISEADAKAAALKRAGIASSDVKQWTKARLDGDEWELEFLTAQYKYEVEINAYTGSVRGYERKTLPSTAVASLTLADAKLIALEHAKQQTSLSGKVKYTKAKLDRDDGWLLYDIEFRCNRYEFDYEIDANNGDILDWDMERDD